MNNLDKLDEEVSNVEKTEEIDNKVAENPFNPRKIRHYVFLVAIILAIVLLVIFSQNDFNEIWSDIQNADFTYIGIAILVGFAYWFLASFSLHILIRKKAGKINMLDSMCIANSSYFFNGITPFSTGGQPFQIYSFNKCGIKPSTSTGVLAMNFIIYQIAINIVSIVSVCLYGKELMSAVNGFIVLVIIGVSINIIVLVSLILIAVSKTFRRILLYFVRKVCKLKILKKRAAKIEAKALGFIMDFQIVFKSLFQNIGLLSITLVLQVLSLVLHFSIPFFIFKALHLDISVSSMLPIIGMSAFALSFMIWIPTPGSSGGAEWAFTSLFPVILVNISGADVINSSTLLWRFVTYYLALLFGFINFMIFQRRHKTNYDQKNVEEQK